ncbi:MAG TPA: AsmA family protein [Candidatus Udaeobacter sp.]|nr:AsmA family protein [Candidatus Udaeobacter sp.]
MNRTLRNLLIIVGAIFVVLLVAPFLIPVNQFRPTIEEKASAALGRKVQLGDLSLSLLTGSLSAENLSIGDDPKFSSSPFLTAKSLKVGVEILPLIFSKSLNVTGVTIDTPQVTLLRNRAGQWNYSSLGGASAKAAAKPTPVASPSGNPGAGEELSVKRLDLKNGTIIIGSTTSQKRSTYDHMNVSASDVSLSSKFPIAVSADLPSGGKLKLDGNIGPVDEADAALTPLDAKLNVSALDLAVTGLLDPGLGLGGLLDLDSTLASQGGEAESKGTVKFSKALLIAGGSPASVPVIVDFHTKYNLQKNTGILEPSTLKIGSAAAHLNGTYENQGEETEVNIKLHAKDMPAKDLQAFLPALGIHLPTGASLETGTLGADLNLTGSVNRLVTNGTVGLLNGKLVGFDLGSRTREISALTGLETGKDLEIEKLTTNLHMAPDGLKADNFLAVLPALGQLTGAGTLDSKNTLDFKMLATLSKQAGATAGSASTGAGGGALGGILGALAGSGGSGGCDNGLKVPFQIKGTTSEPKFVPDVGGIAKDFFKSEFGGCAGGRSASSTTKAQGQGQNPVDALSDLGALFKKKKP